MVGTRYDLYITFNVRIQIAYRYYIHIGPIIAVNVQIQCGPVLKAIPLQAVSRRSMYSRIEYACAHVNDIS